MRSHSRDSCTARSCVPLLSCDKQNSTRRNSWPQTILSTLLNECALLKGSPLHLLHLGADERARSSLACTIQTRIKLASLRAPVLRNAPLGHASRRQQNGESGDVLPSGRGLAALLAAGVPDGRGETWPCTRPHRRRRPARTRPCIPHAPKTLRNRALPIFGEVPAACTIFARTQRLVVRVKMTGF